MHQDHCREEELLLQSLIATDSGALGIESIKPYRFSQTILPKCLFRTATDNCKRN